MEPPNIHFITSTCTKLRSPSSIRCVAIKEAKQIAVEINNALWYLQSEVKGTHLTAVFECLHRLSCFSHHLLILETYSLLFFFFR